MQPGEPLVPGTSFNTTFYLTQVVKYGNNRQFNIIKIKIIKIITESKEKNKNIV